MVVLTKTASHIWRWSPQRVIDAEYFEIVARIGLDTSPAVLFGNALLSED